MPDFLLHSVLRRHRPRPLTVEFLEPRTLLASFMGLGGINSVAGDVSADGSVVVGRFDGALGTEAFRWTPGDGIVGLGFLSQTSSFSNAHGVSDDGSVVVGENHHSPTLFEAFRWTADDGMVGLGNILPPTPFGSSQAFDVSADGSVAVGTGTGLAATEAFRWEADVMVSLGVLPSPLDAASGARGVSADGSVVVGSSSDFVNVEAFRWEAGVMVGLGQLPGGVDISEAFAVSADGSVVVGQADSSSGLQAFRWDDGVMVGLGAGIANDVSGDGSIVVGTSFDPTGFAAFVWDAANEMQDLRDVLIDRGANLTDWELASANGISADGRFVVGSGSFNGAPQAWIADLGIEVDIDIKPGSDPNSINPNSKGKIPVAILSTADFDAPADVDPDSLTFGRTGDEDSLNRKQKGAPHCGVEDANGDALDDLVCHFLTQETGFQNGDTEGILKGQTFAGADIEGTDSVRIVGGKPLHVSGTLPVGLVAGQILPEPMLLAALQHAEDHWRTEGFQGLNDTDIQIADLTGRILGLADPETNTIWIDNDAAGYGWSIDSHRGMDLLTVVAHEVGHILGLQHSHGETDVMASTLRVGTRWLLPGSNLLATGLDLYHSSSASVLLSSGLSRSTGLSSWLSATVADDNGLMGEGEEGFATTDANHVALVDHHLSHRLDKLVAIIDERHEDQDLVGDFDAKLLDDDLVTLLAAEQNDS